MPGEDRQPSDQQAPQWGAGAQQGYPGLPPDHGQDRQQQYSYPASQPSAPPYGVPPGYSAGPGYPAGPSYAASAPDDASRGTSGAAALGRALAVLGLGATGAGLFALPLASYSRPQSGTYFGSVRDFVRLLPDRVAGRFYNGVARIWWDWGLLLATGLLVVLVALVVVVPSVRTPGILITLVALAAGALQAVALAGSADLREASVTFRKDHSMYENAGTGVWVGFAGLGVLVLAGLLLSLSRRRR